VPNPIQGVNTANPVAPTSTGQTGATTSGTAAGGSPPAAPVDSADVGSMESLLQRISAAADQVPTVDQAKIDELRQAIAAGTYQANPQEIARKLLQFEGALDGSGSGQ
jgi:negative regulator of flagellin synthesis FlgM